MLLVKTKVAPSTIEGLGLFADQFIQKGTHVWRFQPGFDSELAQDFIDSLEEVAQDFVRTYTYVSPVTGKHILCPDNDRFCNHADDPNLGEIAMEGEMETRMFALRDIQPGEELTIDYRVMEGTDEPVF